jgi:hypothetical protein
LPKPPTAVLAGETIQSGVVSLRFTTSTSLRAGVLFVVNELPRAGYALSRGDAEAGEADAPFTGPTVVGALRLTRVGPCKTNWILAIVPRSRLNGASPNPGALIPHVTDPEASPLPFG